MRAERGRIRIIGGSWRRRTLAVPSHPELRPTPDRARETLFNWIGDHVVGARCVDLFAGTGALGFEAASRGADHVTLVERDGGIAAHLRRQAEALDPERIEVLVTDAWSWIGARGDGYDLVFIDPPYGSATLGALCERLAQHRRLRPRALVYLEHGADEGVELPPGWRMLRSNKAGRVRYHLALAGGDEGSDEP